MKVTIEERHFNPIVWQSPFVPHTQAPVFALGFARFFQGDAVSASYLLFPQLEASLRHILNAWGADPVRLRDDLTEEDMSIDSIISNHKQTLEKIFGAALVEELDRLFNASPGPKLRHSVAHGLMSAGECFSADSFYGCWLIYRLCCVFLFKRWDDLVNPGIAIEEPGV